MFRNFILFHYVHSVGLFFSTKTFLSSWLHVLLSLSIAGKALQQAEKSFLFWNSRGLMAFWCKKSALVWCYTMLWLCSHHIPQDYGTLCSLCDLRRSWHRTWQTSCHAPTSWKMRGLMLLHHKEIMCLCIYLTHVSGYSSLTPCCWECDRRDCLQGETIAGIKGQTLEKLGGANCHGSRHCYFGLKCLTFS